MERLSRYLTAIRKFPLLGASEKKRSEAAEESPDGIIIPIRRRRSRNRGGALPPAMTSPERPPRLAIIFFAQVRPHFTNTPYPGAARES
jgi:hypothetical protein